MNLWEVTGVPHKGWDLIGVEDLEELIGVCEFCGKTDIRYLHTIAHDSYPDDVEVGCVCCEHLTDDYVRPRGAEHALRLRAKRRVNFEVSERWYRSAKGNLTIKYKGTRVTIFRHRAGSQSSREGPFCRRPMILNAPQNAVLLNKSTS